jgi:hypothetical protein
MKNDLNPELLKQLHILTVEGKLNADSNRKLKQVHHLAQLIQPFLERVRSQNPKAWSMADLGAGKSSLGFILYDLYLKHWPEAHLFAIESRAELVEKSRALAGSTGFERMRFVSSKIEASVVHSTGEAHSPVLPARIEVVSALHACDTATDDAIHFALLHQAQVLALVPCCQAEAARMLEPLGKKSSTALNAAERALIEFPLHRREFGSHLTNVIRCLFLKSKGYRVTVTELVGWEHSMKNELILAEKISDANHPESQRAQQELNELLARFPIRLKLLN